METILDLQARILAKLEGRDRNKVLVELNEILKEKRRAAFARSTAEQTVPGMY